MIQSIKAGLRTQFLDSQGLSPQGTQVLESQGLSHLGTLAIPASALALGPLTHEIKVRVQTETIGQNAAVQ